MIYQALLFYQFQFIIHYVQYSIFKYTFNNPLNYYNNIIQSIKSINSIAFLCCVYNNIMIIIKVTRF